LTCSQQKVEALALWTTRMASRISDCNGHANNWRASYRRLC